MQAEECYPEWRFNQEMLIFIEAVVKDLKNSFEARQLLKFCCFACFQIAQFVVLPVSRTVHLVVFGLGLPKNNLHQAVRRPE
jgi:hypothetical protein